MTSARGRSLRSHLMWLYVLLAIFSGVVVPLLGMLFSHASFQEYQRQGRQAALDLLARSLEDLYRETGSWDRARVMDVLSLPARWGAVNIALRDQEGRVVCAAGPSGMHARGEGHGAKGRARETGHSGHVMGELSQAHGHSSTALSPLDEGSGSKGRMVIQLTSEGRVIGVLDADVRVPQGRFERAFVSHLTSYTLAGTLVMILVACGLGYMVAGRLSRPVARAVERTKRICRREYDLKPAKPSGIREMDDLTRGVEELGRSLAEQERLRQRLMTDVVHELRTPLTVVRSQIEAIADGVWEASPERLALCVSEMERLSGLIRDVESVTRMEGDAVAIKPEPVDLSAFLSSVLDAFRPLFGRTGVALRRSLAPSLHAEVDEDRFRHVMDNLLSNALRYTPKGGWVEVRLRRRGDEAVIEVQDSGSGISPQDLPHVFDRFYRADESRARVTGGRGVGLSIARAVVEAHGGTIGVESESGVGSCFTVTLPAVEGQAARSTNSMDEAESAKGPELPFR
ncbi:sensor histidine kinase [Fretibacterium fastidiosum]|uniref:histidine kinase n=1 Tax=Fretibacterium fastidiosum TaxID=651822 RepID=A0AB94IYZ5_9BACT|nr:ATP-binding protein [Fretibacterium fastidiosum]CBL29001.1 His Kinase A (phosphoacceptor) domain./Histidine kinase-, DNA gyrase B-, and HSP90-like ATPase./HAMP domain [Fretibacterium fastidiosum]